VNLTALVAAALADEHLSAEDLALACWDDPDPAVVLGSPDGAGAVAGVVRRVGDETVGFVRLVAVAPESRRRGLGRSLLSTAEAWLVERGATRLAAGGEAPFYLWPGVDFTATAALCLFEAAGYVDAGAAVNLSCRLPVLPVPPPAGVVVRRVGEEADAGAVRALVDLVWPWWRPELDRGINRGWCHGGFVDGGVAVGFACHSVNRAGWVGPIGTDPAAQRGGVGAALLAAVGADLTAAGHRQAEIAWIGPVGFYVRTVGASVSRVFATRVKRLS
jgi:GNAT superfamily N-acetyltransferase